jgi:hypothetical protein
VRAAPPRRGACRQQALALLVLRKEEKEENEEEKEKEERRARDFASLVDEVTSVTACVRGLVVVTGLG